MSPRRGSTSRYTDWPAISRIVTLTVHIDKDYRLWLTKDRPDLSSEGAPEKNRTITVKKLTNIRYWAPDGTRHQDTLTDRPSVAKWFWLWMPGVSLKVTSSLRKKPQVTSVDFFSDNTTATVDHRAPPVLCSYATGRTICYRLRT
jgi:hypothetical protein